MGRNFKWLTILSLCMNFIKSDRLKISLPIEASIDSETKCLSHWMEHMYNKTQITENIMNSPTQWYILLHMAVLYKATYHSQINPLLFFRQNTSYAVTTGKKYRNIESKIPARLLWNYNEKLALVFRILHFL